MGFTIEDALNQTQEQYQLELLAGVHGCANAISWVHLIEDTTIIRQLWGKELVVTTGLGFQEPSQLLELIKLLVRHHSVGLIINIGEYIKEIPQNIIEYCDEHDFPLLTIPWEIYLADVIKDYSMRCLYSDREDRQISKYFKNVFLDPKKVEESRIGLMDSFDVDGSFQILLVGVEDSDQFDAIEKRRLAFQLELSFEKIECSFSNFWFDDYFVLIVNNLDQGVFDKVIHKMYKRAQKRMSKKHIYVGIGTQVSDLRNIVQSYKRALSAVELSIQFEKDIVYFDQMGIYQILFSIEDKQILKDMYNNLLEPLIHYDQKHRSELVKTLYYYLKYDASPQAIAENMYTHRNTVYYRIDKIKQLLNSQLDSLEEKFPYMIAFYIQRMLKKGDQDES